MALFEGIGEAIGAVIGGNVGAGDKRTARESADAAIKELLAIGVPPDLSKRLVLEKFKAEGIYTPELETAIMQEKTDLGSLKERQPALKAQENALRMMQQSASTGMTNQTQAALNEARRQQDRQLQGALQAQQQQMAAQGMGNSGAAMVQGMLSAQGASGNLAEQQDRQAAMASQAAQDAMRQYGSMAGDIRSQNTAFDQSTAQARDELARFNIGQQTTAQQANVGARNRAMEQDWSNRQKMSTLNTGMMNDETLRANEAKRQFWQDQVDRAKIRSGAYDTKSKDFGDRYKATVGQYSGYGKLIGKGAEAYASGGASEVSPGNVLSSTDVDEKKYNNMA